MQVYTVYEPPTPAAGIDERAEQLVFVRDGFEFPAFVFGPFWLLAHRLWLGFVLYMAAALLVIGLMQVIPGGGGVIAGVWMLAAIVFGLEANSIRRWTLERNGYHAAGIVAGRSFEECEHRFLTGWLTRRQASTARFDATLPPTAVAAPITHGAAMG